MKKFNLFVLASVFTLALAGCGGGESSVTPSTTSEEGTSVSQETTSTNPNAHPVDIDVGDAPTYDEPSIQFHYYRQDNTYQNWNLWLWEKGFNGAQFDFNGKDDWGVIASYPLSTWTDPIANTLGFLVRLGEWEAKDLGGNDIFVNFAEFDKDANDVYHIYLISGQSDIYIDANGNKKGSILSAEFTTTSKITVKGNMNFSSYKIKEDNTVLVEVSEYDSATVTYAFETGVKPKFSSAYTIDATFVNGDKVTVEISKNALYNDEEFTAEYNYDGDDLGAVYSSEQTTFKVWSPVSTSIKVRLYDNGYPISGETYQEFPMEKGDKGVFSYKYVGDLQGKYYTYIVTNSSFNNREIVDPYAKSAGLSGLRGMIVDFSKTNPEGWEEMTPYQYDRKSLVVYETHVSDVTSSSTWNGSEANRKKFLGVIESGTTYEGVTTGFDHIKELGVNAVQLLPIFDQANDESEMVFNWGYNPLNYNCLEGSYSSDPTDGYVRIREFKQLVKAFHDNGINIIMDVVYNHVNSAQGSNFDVLMPGYYYRYVNGVLSNGSGCGNETASEHYMMRKFIKDSTAFWAEEYKLGGFRFDLMGLHDMETMNQVVANLKTINESICVYGEPWTGGTTPLSANVQAIQANEYYFQGYGAFNDHIRDGLIKGGLSARTAVGYATNMKTAPNSGDIGYLKYGLRGITVASKIVYDPNKTLNYVTCHDNYTLFDRAIATGRFTAEDDYDTLKKMNVLANSIIFTSQGTSFMLAGEEFLRTKGGNSNSYNASYEVNELDYSLKVKNADMVENYKKLINLKTTVDAFSLEQHEIAQYVTSDAASSVITNTINTGTESYLVIYKNGYLETQDVEIPEDYSLVWDTLTGSTAMEIGTTVTMHQFETLILKK